MNCRKCGGKWCSVVRCLPDRAYTNAEKQKRARDRAKAKLERYEAALAQIAYKDDGPSGVIAECALQDK